MTWSSDFPVPQQKAPDETTSLAPHPRHRARSLFNARPTSRANHPTYHNFELHVVDDDDHDDPAGAGSGSSTTSPASLAGDATTHNDGCSERHIDCVSPGDRQPHRGVLEPVRTGHRAVGDRDRLARVELPTRRGESHWLLLDLPDGTAPARRLLRGGWVSRLVRSTLRRQGIDSGRSVAVCVLGLITLAALALEVMR